MLGVASLGLTGSLVQGLAGAVGLVEEVAGVGHDGRLVGQELKCVGPLLVRELSDHLVVLVRFDEDVVVCRTRAHKGSRECLQGVN